NLPMVTVRVVSDVVFSSLDLFCRAPPEQPLANASAGHLGWLPDISFCAARDDSFALVSLHCAFRASRLPPVKLLELHLGPVTLVHPTCASNKTMPFRQVQGPELCRMGSQPLHGVQLHFTMINVHPFESSLAAIS